MKNTILYTSLIAELFLTTIAVAAQTTSGGGVAPIMPPRGAIVSPNQTPTPVKPGLPGTPGSGVQPQVGFQTSTGTTPTNSVAATTNLFSGTNALAGVSNNSPSVTATVNPTTNAIINPQTDINGNTVVGDQTVTASDRVLLTTLSQGVKATLGITPNGNLPVHFMINNGTVTVVGTVQSAQQSQSILTQVRQTPGVLNVVSDLRVASPLATVQSSSSSPSSAFIGPADHAFSPRDQTLLTTVQQQAAMQLGINNASQMPVHFSIQNGVVGVTGHVSSLQEKQSLLAAIQKTPGIVRVVDNVGVQEGAAPMNDNGNLPLPPTSRDITRSNSIFLNNTNASGF